MENNGKKREWVKNAIIIFLVIMLLLTFFSNTIMNYSLPEVSAQYVRSGTLSEQIRGSGTVEATQSYEVKMDETRTIAGVSVSVGDEVEKGAVLYTLEDKESSELDSARQELAAEEQTLDDLQLDYDKALLKTGVDYSKENLDIQNQEEDIALAKENLSKLSEYQAEYEKAKAVTKTCEDTVNNINDQLTALAAEDYASMGTSYYTRISSAKTKLENKENAKARTEENIKKYESEIASGGNQDSIAAAERAVENKELELSQAQQDYMDEYQKENYDAEAVKALQQRVDSLNLELTHLREDYEREISKSSEYNRSRQYLQAEQTTLSINETEVATAKKNFDDTVAAVKIELKDMLKDAENELSAAKDNEAALEKKANKTVEELESEIRDKERALETAKLDLEIKQRSDAQSAGEDALDIRAKQEKISDQKEKIARCLEEIKKLEEKSTGASVTAPVAGKITKLDFSAGEEAAQGAAAATIEMSEKGYTLEMTVTVEQSKKVKLGDEAEVQYFWNGEANAVLRSISSDTQNPARSRILQFSVTGDVTPGETLQLAMGSKGQPYDIIVPNSAVREDSSGKFVLKVVSKSSPLGNRYTAERVSVEVLASDDTSSAVTGDIFQGDFIITASAKPVEAGAQVRLADN